MKICFIGANPKFNGGISLYQKNLIEYLKKSKKDIAISWIYLSRKNEKYSKKRINYIGLKIPKIIFLEDILFNMKILKILKNNNFDVINSHAIWGKWMKNYTKKDNQKVIHTYHGVTYYFLKNSLKRFGLLKKIIFSPLLVFGYIMENSPMKKADEIICVSEKVKRHLSELYNPKREMNVLRTGVNLKNFKIQNKNKVRKNLKLDTNKTYGLYVGRGGYWTKGLDRTIKISEEICKLDKNYRLIVIGADYNKVKHLLDKKFIIFLETVPREKIKLYYSASDIFFCLSRYEGGAPTLVVSEAMASGCLLVCSKDSEQEIIKNNENGLIIKNFDEKEAKGINLLLNSKIKKEEIIKNSLRTIKELSFELWGEKYYKILK